MATEQITLDGERVVVSLDDGDVSAEIIPDWRVEFEYVFTYGEDEVINYYGQPAVVCGFDHVSEEEMSAVYEAGYRVDEVKAPSAHSEGDGMLVLFTEREDIDSNDEWEPPSEIDDEIRTYEITDVIHTDSYGAVLRDEDDDFWFVSKDGERRDCFLMEDPSTAIDDYEAWKARDT